jgi:6-phosphogluconate dehydrogenase (decarboxylating)
METSVINLERMEAKMMSRLLPADHRCVVYSRQRISIDRAEVECEIALCGGSVGASFLTSDIASVRDGLSRRRISLAE